MLSTDEIEREIWKHVLCSAALMMGRWEDTIIIICCCYRWWLWFYVTFCCSCFWIAKHNYLWFLGVVGNFRFENMFLMKLLYSCELYESMHCYLSWFLIGWNELLRCFMAILCLDQGPGGWRLDRVHYNFPIARKSINFQFRFLLSNFIKPVPKISNVLVLFWVNNSINTFFTREIIESVWSSMCLFRNSFYIHKTKESNHLQSTMWTHLPECLASQASYTGNQKNVNISPTLVFHVMKELSTHQVLWIWTESFSAWN